MLTIIRYPSGNRFLIANVYIPPSSSKFCCASFADVCDEIDEAISSMLLGNASNLPIIMVGDFNARIGTLTSSNMAYVL